MTCAICPKPAQEGSHLCASHHATMYFDWEIRCVETGRKVRLRGKSAKEFRAERMVGGRWVRLDS